MNTKTNENRIPIPKSDEFISNCEWFRAVHETVNADIVFASVSALEAIQYFNGCIGETTVFVYGNKSLEDMFENIVVIGEEINIEDIEEARGVKFTSFNRTLIDMLYEEKYMQAFVEALSYYYYTHEEKFDGLNIPDDVKEKFNYYADVAIHYYDN